MLDILKYDTIDLLLCFMPFTKGHHSRGRWLMQPGCSLREREKERALLILPSVLRCSIQCCVSTARCLQQDPENRRLRAQNSISTVCITGRPRKSAGNDAEESPTRDPASTALILALLAVATFYPSANLASLHPSPSRLSGHPPSTGSIDIVSPTFSRRIACCSVRPC